MTNAADSSLPPASVTPTSAKAALIPEHEWDKLLAQITSGQVVPVIGPELLCIPQENNPVARLYDLWGQDLAKRQGIEEIPASDEIPLLYSISNQLSLSNRLESGDLEAEIHGIIHDKPWPVPEPLRLLAEIHDFPLYLTTTIDHLMEKAIQETRGSEVLQRTFMREGNSDSNDLPQGYVPGKQPVIFHLFGASSLKQNSFAATEDDLIDYSWALIGREGMRLYDFLEGKRMLMLGCDFPDWLERFFINALARKGNGRISVTYVSQFSQKGLHGFLQRRFRTHLLPTLSPLDFVAELHRRWQAQQQTKPHPAIEHDAASWTPTRSKRGAVFLSYAREDKAAVEAIRAQLEAANIDTWMDEDELEPGSQYQYVIQDNIRDASFFLAIVSSALDLSQSSRPGRFVLREWKWAEDANLDHHKDEGFLQVVVVDDTPAGASFVDSPFRDLHWTVLQDGKLPAKLIKILQKGIRRFRQTKGASK